MSILVPGIVPSSGRFNRGSLTQANQPVNPGPSTAGWSGNIITSTGSNGTSNAGLVNIWYRRSILTWSYTAAEISAAFGGKTSATISRIRFDITQQPANQPLPNYAIGMKQGTFSGANPGNTGYTIIKSASDESFTTGVTKSLNFTTNFSWNNQDLAITFAWGQCPTNYSSTGQTPTGTGSMWYTWQDGAGTYVINTDSASTLVNYRPVVQLYCE